MVWGVNKKKTISNYKRVMLRNRKSQILGNQLVVMSREDLNSLVNEMAQNIVAAQKTVQGTNSEWMSLPDGDRFITREEASKLLHVDYSTLWRWNKLGLLVSRKVGPRRVVYKYSDVLRRLNVEHKTEQKGEEHDGGC